MGKRKQKFLEPLHAQSIPREFLFFDTETYIKPVSKTRTELPLRLGVLIHVTLSSDLRKQRRHVHRFRSKEEFIELIQSYMIEKKTLYIFAHNIGFDIMVLDLVKLFNDFGFTSNPPIKNGRQFIWKVSRNKSRLWLLDTANLGVISVSQLGNIIRKEKGTVDFQNTDDDTLFEYCQNDVEILEDFVLSYITFIHENNLGKFKTTIAGQALSTFRTRFMKTAPYIHIYEPALKLERDAYHGGRTEAFFKGNLPVDTYYYVDVNSMYPFAMTQDKLPLVLMGYSENVPVQYIKPRLARFYCIMDVLLETKDNFACIVRDNKLLFPIGTYRVTLHQSELEYALQHANILKVYRCAVYTHAPIFKDYISFFHDMKNKASHDNNKAWRYIAKLYMNSLYGKFGQRQSIREFIAEVDFKGVLRIPSIDIGESRRIQEFYWFGDLYREYKEGETVFSVPALAGAITAIARMRLWYFIKTAGRKNVFYCDTDSLITNYEGIKALSKHINPDVLGDLELEKIAHLVTIHGPKDYNFQGEERKKGIPRSAKEIQAGQWEYEQFAGWLQWLNGGAEDTMHTDKRIKQRRHVNAKGIVKSDNRIEPFNLLEEDITFDYPDFDFDLEEPPG